MYRRLAVIVALGVFAVAAQEQKQPEMRSFPDAAAPARVGVGVTQRNSDTRRCHSDGAGE